jgi:hypothetical protein
MNAKDVLSKIITMLSAEKEVAFTDAKTADGTILQSPTFDLGESVEVVSEDGTKSPAPDGEHEIALKDSEGKEVVIRVVTKDGKITERENVEEAQPEVPENEDMASIAGEDVRESDDSNTADETVQPLTEDMGKVVEEMGYRIAELEKKFEDMKAEWVKTTPLPGDEPTEMKSAKDEEEELPKLDGAPLDEQPKPTGVKFGKKVASAQGDFLSKLYK